MISRRTLCAMLPLSLAAASCGRPQGGAASSPPADIGGPFSLVDQDGAPVSEAALQGKWSAIYFGFTYCPDVCPTSLMTLKEGLDRLGPRARDVQTYLISVDPERDTPEVMKAYLDNSAFPAGIRGLTGTPEQVAQAAKAYKVFFQKDGEGENYLVQHQSVIFLMDPRGHLARPLTHGLTPDEIAAQIDDAMRQYG